MFLSRCIKGSTVWWTLLHLLTSRRIFSVLFKCSMLCDGSSANERKPHSNMLNSIKVVLINSSSHWLTLLFMEVHLLSIQVGNSCRYLTETGFSKGNSMLLHYYKWITLSLLFYLPKTALSIPPPPKCFGQFDVGGGGEKIIGINKQHIPSPSWIP